VPKIICVGADILLAVSGEWGFEQIAKSVLDDMRNNSSLAIDTLSEFVMETNRGKDLNLDVHIMAVTRRRDLFYMGVDGVYYDVKTDFWAIGCGHDLGWGYLSAIAEHGKVLPVHAKQAIHMASRRDPGVGYDTVEENLWGS
jgi:hypothetical protein